VITRMWEVRAERDGFDRLLGWVRDVAVPAISAEPGHSRTEVYRSDDDRIVVISHWTDAPRDLPEPPAGLAARPPHAWNFTPVE
jgi:quinol monooxygenase YgiN